MNKRVGFIGLMAMATMGLFHPAVASAQDRDDYRRGYGHADAYHDRDPRFDHRWRGDEWRRNEWRDREFRERAFREAREREFIREREWRERQRCERGYGLYYGYHY